MQDCVNVGVISLNLDNKSENCTLNFRSTHLLHSGELCLQRESKDEDCECRERE